MKILMDNVVMKNNEDFVHIINDYYGSKYVSSSPECDAWNKSNVIVIEFEGEKYLRQTRYYPYDLYSSRRLDEIDWGYIIDKQDNILLIHEDGSYSVFNTEH